MTWYFPDLSYYNPNAKIADILSQSGGVLCIRAGDGDFKDPKFDTWRDQARSAKVLMIYQFVRKSKGSPAKNADLFVSHLRGARRPNEVLVMDVEPASGKWSKAECEAFMKRVRDRVGGPPLMIYANQAYAQAQGLSPLFTPKAGWVAKWGQPGKDTSPPSIGYIAWQHAADGYGRPRVRWAGCGADTDENRVDGLTQSQYAATLLGSTPTPPAPKPPEVSSDCCS